MATINISSITQYKKTKNGSKSYTGTGTGSTRGAAERAAKSAATSKANSGGGGTIKMGSGGSSDSGLSFGTTYSITSSGTASVTASSYEDTYWASSATCSGNSHAGVYQIKLAFTLPSGVIASNIATATLKFVFSYNWSSNSNASFGLYAPKGSTDQTQVENPESSTVIELKKSLTMNPSSGATITSNTAFDIKDAFKQCITNNQGWLTLAFASDSVSSGRQITISGTPVITYTLSTSKTSAPTTINSLKAIEKPNTNVTISWSGASAGAGTSTISGYTIYWKVDGTPTTSLYTGSASVTTTATSGSYTFTIPSGATRGSTYYFKVVTKSNAGAGYNSDISTAQASVKVNQLPGVPTISANRTRIPSTGGSVTFTVTRLGTDKDSGQTISTYWATSPTGTKTKIDNNTYTTDSLSSGATYYFWAYDGLEYSLDNIPITITKNTPPTIGSITMTAVDIYTPSKNSRSYVKNINGTASGVTGTNVTYHWKLCVGSGTGATSFGTVTEISTDTSFSNIDVTAYGATFNTAYKLALVVTDGLGESSPTVYSSNIFCIPAAPTIIIYNKSDADSNVSGAASYFEKYLRIKYSENNTGVSKILRYKSGNEDWTEINLSTLSGDNLHSVVDLSSLYRGKTYEFQVSFTCNKKIATTSSVNRIRARDLKPTDINVLSNPIKPYTNNTISVDFNGIISSASDSDVGTYANTYRTYFEFESNTQEVTSSGTVNQGNSSIINSTWTINTISTEDWSALMGTGSYAPNSSYSKVSVKIVATNKFGEPFFNTKQVTLNFIEGFNAQGTVKLQIKATPSGSTTATWVDIPNTTYRTYESQTIRIYYSGLKSYDNHSARISLLDGNTEVKYTETTLADWGNPTNHIYTCATKTVEYQLPKCTTTVTKTYKVMVKLGNGKTITINTGAGLTTTKLYRTMTNSATTISIPFKLTSCSVDNNTYSIGWQCNDFGSDGTSAPYRGGYSTITAKIKYSSSPNDNYNDLGTADTITGSSGNISKTKTGITADIIYFGAIVTVTQNYQTITVSNTTYTPTGTKTYTYTCYNQQKLYKESPNLLYGKNFFVLNKDSLLPNTTDQLLEIHPTNNRDKIYFGDSSGGLTSFQITTNGLVIDCGSW